jgi:hypothetical protein
VDSFCLWYGFGQHHEFCNFNCKVIPVQALTILSAELMGPGPTRALLRSIHDLRFVFSYVHRHG